MIAGTVLMAACDKKQPEVAKSTPPVTSPAPASPAAVPTPPPPTVASPTESKDGTPPIQGQVDSRQPAQKRDFQTR